jgi:uncharacterized protein (TIGR00251 family)
LEVFEGMETLLELVVHPRKPKFGFMHPDEWSSAWHVQVVSPPLHDEANVEILKECLHFFGAPVQLIRGQKSSRKIIRVSLSRERVEQILRNKMTLIKTKNK